MSSRRSTCAASRCPAFRPRFDPGGWGWCRSTCTARCRGPSGGVTPALSGSTVPFRSIQSTLLSGVRDARTSAPIRAVPHAAVVPDQDVIRVIRIHREGVEVRVQVPAEIEPRLTAVRRAEDAARLRAQVVAERAAGVDDVRVRRVDFDDVVVEALRPAVVLDAVRVARPVARQLGPAGACIRRLEHLGDVVRAVRRCSSRARRTARRLPSARDARPRSRNGFAHRRSSRRQACRS